MTTSELQVFLKIGTNSLGLPKALNNITEIICYGQ